MKLIQENSKLDLSHAGACGVYGFLFPDNKWLVGYSSDIIFRVCQYRRGDRKTGNYKFISAVEKFGWDSVKVYILEECPNNKGTLLAKEGRWSRKLDSVKNGYNAAPCGQKSNKKEDKYNVEFRLAVSAAMKEYHRRRKEKGLFTYNSKTKRQNKNLAATPSVTDTPYII